MVVLNNGFSGVNDPATDAYVRNLHDFRVGVELAVLPILNYLISKPKFVLPSALFEKEREYLEFLAKRYHKQPLQFTTSDADELIFRLLVSAIEKSRKKVSYCLNDLLDLVHMHGDNLTQTRFHKNIVLTSLVASEKFYKLIPGRFQKEIDLETDELVPVKPTYAPKLRFKSPLELYGQVMYELFRTIDFELLKLYDFLFEFGYREIRSSALLEIIDEVLRLGQEQYTKVGIHYDGKTIRRDDDSISILPSTDQTLQDLMIEEWCSNLRRALELKDLLEKDVRKAKKEYKSLPFLI
ncbi:MAG: hypothetical protein KC535_03370 [Nanoarchaeota archaeon]|nr:hypothetical protein [Nanoarchaeota archaeon]